MTEPYETQRQIAAPGPITCHHTTGNGRTWLDAPGAGTSS
jgi:hypothetical protein